MTSKTKLIVVNGTVAIGIVPLLSLYVAMWNGFSDIVSIVAIGAIGYAVAIGISVPATIRGMRLLRGNPELPKLFSLIEYTFVAMVLIAPMVFAACG